ncbi:2-oxo acid dehydrogenase subunit E2 [Aurantimicrobium sp. MWH-Uga1]|uniref:2-oxo acid dehydrogenase subunit E2 n=1 Tax=Aurantimicrobium sp. MWH-Uga1 TaxID=2079575 RepID=UPI000DEDA4F5|nr:2-oxo acid dehydrogenase subunit E2 [Aurantimicrobium sp. MWH-Uga1]AXE54605.1 Dihydrolipoyllysine-residue acetyltransferase component of pyruvate dehydrogenase complex [Aurantimicrobium sp. MWH-Uga1]
MSESVSLPALGESVTEGTVTRWLKNVGDRVEVDEPLLEVSTDKVDTEIPSPISGVVEAILVQEDETVAVGTVLAHIGDGSGSAAPAAPAAEAPAAEPVAVPVEAPAPAAAPVVEAPVAAAPPVVQAPVVAPPVVTPPVVAPPVVSTPVVAPAASAAPAGGHASNAGYVTPIVRKLANENGVDLNSIVGTGIGGRIRKEDVLSARSGSAPAAKTRTPLEVSPLRGTTVPMSRLRKVVAERAVISMQSTAQLTSVVEVDVTRIAELRQRVQSQFVAATGGKLSFMPFFALAATEALKAFPIINATVEGDNIVYPGYENVSIAVDTERGLLTPVVKNAGELNIAQYSMAIADVALRTRENKLQPDELAGGTFTLTNTGSRGALFDTPVVFLPQLAILGTGVVTKRPVVIQADGQEVIAIRSMVYLALSYDHRIIDGADAARFLGAIKERLEEGAFEADLGI